MFADALVCFLACAAHTTRDTKLDRIVRGDDEQEFLGKIDDTIK